MRRDDFPDLSLPDILELPGVVGLVKVNLEIPAIEITMEDRSVALITRSLVDDTQFDLWFPQKRTTHEPEFSPGHTPQSVISTLATRASPTA